MNGIITGLNGKRRANRRTRNQNYHRWGGVLGDALKMEPLEDRIMLTLLGQQLFPSDNPWNQKVTQAPVAANSSAIINAIVSKYGDGRLHPDFGQDTKSSNPLYGIPYTIVHGNSVPNVHVVIDAYSSQSDIQDAPIPSTVTLEGDKQNGPVVGQANRGDSHLILWDEDNNIAYEFYAASRPSENSDGKWHADSEAVWNMKTDTFRTLGWTSADAAGLSILAGLVRPDEGLPVSEGGQGVINHAIRFTLQNAVILNQFLYPASHTANPGNNNAAVQPPMGARFRLKSSVDISTLNPESRVIAQAMKDYGMILADNGSNFFFSGASYSVDANNQFGLTWNDSDIQNTTHGLKSLLYSDFEVVNLQPIVAGLSAPSAAAGSQITVTGQDFSGAAGRLEVLFGSVPATSINIIDDTHLTAIVPAGSGAVDVRVQSGVSDPNDAADFTNPLFGYGISAITPADQFTTTTGGTVNHSPSTPSNITPAAGASGVQLTPTLQANSFSDPDTGDTQAASDWQVFRASDSTLVYDSGTDATHLTSLPLPSGILANSTGYEWQVRYEDNHGAWSSYSVPTSFTTVAAAVSSVQIDAGGPASGSFVADTDFAGGKTYAVTSAIDTSAVANPAPQAVYQTERYGNFSYTVPNLTPGSQYTVQLDFAELYWSAANQRLFNVSINGQSVLVSFDIYAAAGATRKAIARSFTTAADSNGRVVITFTSVKDNAKVDGIEITPAGSPTPTPTPTATSTRIDAGGPASGSFIADTDFTGGKTYAVSSAIDTSAIANPAAQAVYQTERYGNFTYTILSLTPSAKYTVELDFDELYWNAIGQRLFNVSINGATVLTNFDVYKTAGAKNKVITEQFTATADASGKVTILFTSVKDNAKVNAIVIAAA